MSEIYTTLALYDQADIKPILFQCTSSYPASDKDLNVSAIRQLKDYFGVGLEQ